MTERTTVPETRSTAGSLALCAILAMTVFIASPKSAQAAAPTSTLCGGYAACSRGMFTTHGYPIHYGTSYWRMYSGSNCTNYVAFVESTFFGVATPSYLLGNAGQWPTNAAAHGALVNNIPTVGSVAEWNGGSPGIPSPGHVAIVEAVGPQNSYIVISQENILDVDGYNWVRINADGSGNQWEQWPSNFIHFTGVRGALIGSANPSTVKVVVRVTPAKFGNDRFEFNDGVGQPVAPGLVTVISAGTHSRDYAIGFRNASFQKRYVLHVTVSGSNIQVLHQGGPYASSRPRIRISGIGNAQVTSIVAIDVRPGGTNPTTLVTAPTSTTSTVPFTATTTTSTLR